MRYKLNSNAGATFVFALVVFLIMSVFCFTIVNAALSGVRNAGAQQAQEQAYLTVDSAARLLQASLAADGMQRVVTEFSYAPAWLDGGYALAHGGWNPSADEYKTKYSPENAYNDIFQLAAMQLVEDADNKEASPSRKLTVEATDLADVTVTLEMAKDYGLTAVFADDGYTMTMTLEARPVPKAVSSTRTISHTETVGEGEDAKTVTVIDGYQTKTVTTTTFTWAADSVRGGES